MPTLINTTHPYLRIRMPDDSYEQFVGGKLDIDEKTTVKDGDEEREVDNPHFAAVMAEAVRNPYISVIENATTCYECGQVFSGKLAKADLAKHRKASHPNEYERDRDAATAVDRQVELKARAGIVCDVCSPVQTFGELEGPGSLAEHVSKFHATRPTLDEEGNTVGTAAAEGPGAGPRSRRPGEVDIPAAKASAKNS